MQDTIIEDDTGYYCRTSSKLKTQLCSFLESCYSEYHPVKAVIYSSGMQSIFFAVDSVLEKLKYSNLNIIHGSELYCDTLHIFSKICRKHVKNYKIDEIDVQNSEQIIDKFRTKFLNQNNILFIESCSNPSGYVFDFSIISTLRSISKNLFVIVDNTWLTHVVFNPFIHDVDIVLSSLTKYYSAGTAMGGVVLFKNDQLYRNAFYSAKTQGIHIDQINLTNILINSEIMKDNITRSSNLTIRIIDFLVSNGVLVFHPYVSGISFKNGLYPSVILFKLQNMDKNRLQTKIKNILTYETSFGSSYSKIDRWPIAIGNDLLVRLYVGYNDNYESLTYKLTLLLS